jgi:hypothetical protein
MTKARQMRHKIDHPALKQSVQGVPVKDTDTDTNVSFVAFGRSTSNLPIKGKLSHVDPNMVKNVKMKTLVAGPHWIILFSNVPQPQNYKLEIMDSDGDSFEVSVSSFHVAGPTRGTTISYPGSNNPVSQSFSAYGSTDSTDCVTGTLSSQGSIQGTTIQDGPLWIVQFSNVAPGTYTLSVTANPTSATLPGVVVQSSGPGGPATTPGGP